MFAGIVEGGLGVLERVGRKTMDILKETDGGLETTRAVGALFDEGRQSEIVISAIYKVYDV